MGQHERAAKLVSSALEATRQRPVNGFSGRFHYEACALAVAGELDDALSVLGTLTDQRFSLSWGFLLDHDPHLYALRKHPDFDALRSRVENLLAEQRVRIDELIGRYPDLRDPMAFER